MKKDILVSVVAPMYNEELVIEKYINEAINILKNNYLHYELIIVDDGSGDHSSKIVKNLQKSIKNIRLISLSRNYGREIAITAGLDVSIGDYVVVMDTDLQDPPSLIPALINKALLGNDIVYASRQARDGESFVKKLTSKYFYKITSYMTGLKIPEDAGDFRVFNRKVINSILQLKEQKRYMKMLYAYVGFKVDSIPFKRDKRFAGTTKYNYVKLINASLDAIVGFSTTPLRIVSIFSFLISFFLFIISSYVLLSKLFLNSNAIEGWSSTIVLMSLMFCILFIFLAVISEYLGRVLIETKNRPLYYITEETSSCVLKTENVFDDL